MLINKEHLREIFAEVKENARKLQDCKGPHRFNPISSEGVLKKKYQCEICGGVIDAIGKHWYDQGLKHGRRLNV